MSTYRRGGVFSGGVFGDDGGEGGGITAALTSGDGPDSSNWIDPAIDQPVMTAQGGGAAALTQAAIDYGQQQIDKAGGGGGGGSGPTLTSGGDNGVTTASTLGDAVPWIIGGAILVGIGVFAASKKTSASKPGYKANRRRRRYH